MHYPFDEVVRVIKDLKYYDLHYLFFSNTGLKGANLRVIDKYLSPTFSANRNTIDAVPKITDLTCFF